VLNVAPSAGNPPTIVTVVLAVVTWVAVAALLEVLKYSLQFAEEPLVVDAL